MPHPHPRGYAAEPGSAELRDLTESNPAVPWTAGAMISTLDDLRVWSKALATGTLLSPAMQRERLRWQPLSFESGREFGYGLGIMNWHGFLGHAGAIFGYSTWMLHSPQDDATLVVLANRGETETEFASKITNDILHQLFPEQFPREANPPASATPEA
jgi:D-alanyl-D-alanine carboxypeptidase